MGNRRRRADPSPGATLSEASPHDARHFGRATTLGLGVLMIAALVAACSAPVSAVTQTPVPRSGTGQPSAGPALQSDYVQVVNTVLPSVVQITTAAGLGSGVVLDDKGDIVTNAHVVGTATTFQVRLANNPTTFPATLVGAYPPDDLAVIHLQPPTGLPRTFGDSSKLQIGDIVLAMGNPLGLTGSVTDGIVSAVGRAVTEPAGDGSPGATLPQAIQTSAAINPGNSGGALVDLSARWSAYRRWPRSPRRPAVPQRQASGSRSPATSSPTSPDNSSPTAAMSPTPGEPHSASAP